MFLLSCYRFGTFCARKCMTMHTCQKIATRVHLPVHACKYARLRVRACMHTISCTCSKTAWAPTADLVHRGPENAAAAAAAAVCCMRAYTCMHVYLSFGFVCMCIYSSLASAFSPTPKHLILKCEQISETVDNRRSAR